MPNDNACAAFDRGRKRRERKKEGNNVTEKELYEHVGCAEEIVVRPVNE